MNGCSRREFLKCTWSGWHALTGQDPNEILAAANRSPVALIKTDDRSEGVKNSLRVLGVNPVREQSSSDQAEFQYGGRVSWLNS